MKTIMRYRFCIIILLINMALLVFYPMIGKRALFITSNNLPFIIFTLIPIFILIGLLDIWIDRELMIKFMGNKSGIKGISIAFFLGVITAIPLYSLLPMADLFIKKGAKLSNVLIFICSCTSIRIPLLLFEASSMGWRFSLISFILYIPIIIVSAFLIEKILSKDEKESLYERAKHF